MPKIEPCTPLTIMINEAGLSVGRAAKAIRCSPQHLFNAACGERNLSDELIWRLARVSHRSQLDIRRALKQARADTCRRAMKLLDLIPAEGDDSDTAKEESQ